MSEFAKQFAIKNVRALEDFITNADTNDIRSNIAIDMRGALIGRAGILAERDWGTIHRADTYPTTGTLDYGLEFFNGTHFRDSQNGYIYEILAGFYYEGAQPMIMFYQRRDDDGNVGAWSQLLQMYQAQIDEVDSGTNYVGFKLFDNYAYDIFGNTVNPNNLDAVCQYWQVYNATRGSWAFIKDFGTHEGKTTFLTHIAPNAFPVAWNSPDKVYIVQNSSIWDLIQPSAPTTESQYNAPTGLEVEEDTIVNWVKNEDLAKVLALWHAPSAPSSKHTPIRFIRLNSAQTIFNDDDYQRTSGWQAHRSQPDNTFVRVGSPKSPKTENGVYLQSAMGGAIQIAAQIDNGVSGAINYRLVVCPVYYGYLEGDPIYQVYIGDDTANKYFKMNIAINPGQLDTAITAFRLYYCLIPDGSSQEDYLDDWDNYFELVKSDGSAWWDLENDTNWETSTNRPTGITAEYSHHKWNTLLGASFSDILYGPSLFAMLNRPPDLDRSYAQPRFAAQVSQTLTSVNVVDIDDRTLAFSCYAGTGAHQDEVWPDVSVDNTGTKIRQILNGSGPVYGLGSVGNNVVIFRQASIEITDTFLTAPYSYPADCVSQKSIINTPAGLIWAGEAGIYIMGSDGSLPKLLNASWQNLYDGRVLNIDQDAPRITTTYRQNVICGYNPRFQELWVHICVNQKEANVATFEYVNFRYNFNLRKWWSIRTLNVGSSVAYGAIKYFDQHPNRFLVVGYSHTATANRGIIQYPNQTGDYYHHDDVISTADSEGNGVSFYILANFGDLYDLVNRAILHDYIVDFEGLSTDKLSRLETYLYHDEDKPAFDDKSFYVDKPSNFLRVGRIGRLDRLIVKIGVRSGDEDTLQRLEIKQLTMRFIERSVNTSNL